MQKQETKPKTEQKVEKKKKIFPFEKASKIIILALALLIPLFYTNIGVLDFNKQVLLIVLCFLTLITLLIGKISKEDSQIRISPMSLLLTSFVIIVAISAALAQWKWGSFWGWPSDTASSFLTVLCFFLLYHIIASIFKNVRDIFRLQSVLIISGAIVAIIGVLQLAGKFFLPWDLTKTTSFNTIGTTNSWGIFLGVLIAPILTLILVTKKMTRVVFSILGVIILMGLIICNYWVAWIGVLFSMIILLALGLWKIRETDSKLLILPLLLFSMALIFGVLKVSIPTILSTPLEVSPSLRATLDTSVKMLKASTKDLILGWGPGSFKYGWSKFKSSALNQTIFWNVRFTKGGTEILETLGSIGLLGTALYIAIFITAVVLSIKQFLIFQKEKKSLQWALFLGAFCSFISLSAIKMLYPANVSLGFLWWLFLGILTASSVAKGKIINMKIDSKQGFLFSFVIILALIGSVFMFYLQGARYLAEAKYEQAFRAGESFETVERRLLEAIGSNPYQEIIFRDLAQLYLAKANQEAVRTDITDEQKMADVGRFVGNAVAAARRATEINPKNVANWQTRGATYKNLIGMSEGAFDWAIKTYESALELEPTNPFILLEISRIYLAQSNLVSEATDRESLLIQAEDSIKKAIDLKPDYAPAFYQMALIYESQGRREQAISTLEALKQSSTFLLGYDPTQDVGLAFQLGVLYYQNEQYDSAQEEFERAIALNPNYSNARYFLGLIYDKKGDIGKAIEQFAEIETFNPENEEVKKILTNLREGRTALEGIITTPEVLPIEKEPEEQ